MSTHDKRSHGNKKALAYATVFGLAAVGVGLIWYGTMGEASSPNAGKFLVSLGCCCLAAGLGGFVLWQVVKRAW